MRREFSGRETPATAEASATALPRFLNVTQTGRRRLDLNELRRHQRAPWPFAITPFLFFRALPLGTERAEQSGTALTENEVPQ